MKKIIFKDKSESKQAKVQKLADNLVQISGCEVNLSGFHLANAIGTIYGKHEDFTTLYRAMEDGFILSNDGSVYIEPESIPDPEKVGPTLEQLQERKISEMKQAKKNAIKKGITDLILDRAEQVLWNTSDETEQEGISFILESVIKWITVHVIYFRDLSLFIYSLQEKEAVEVISYGMPIPEEYQSEALKTINVEKYMTV